MANDVHVPDIMRRASPAAITHDFGESLLRGVSDVRLLSLCPTSVLAEAFAVSLPDRQFNTASRAEAMLEGPQA